MGRVQGAVHRQRDPRGAQRDCKKSTVASTAQRLAAAAMEGVDEDAQRLKVRSVDHTSERGLLEMVAAPDTDTAEEWEKSPPPGLALFWDEIGSV